MPDRRDLVRLLAMLGRIDPRLWDFIVPQWYKAGYGMQQAYAAPMPYAGGDRDTYALDAARLAHEVVGLAAVDDARGQDAASWVARVIDDWCGTGWPRPWPRPRPWPWPDPDPEPGPQPDPWVRDLVATGQVAAAVVFASAASRMRGGDLADALGDGAARLAEAAIGGAGEAPSAPVRKARAKR